MSLLHPTPGAMIDRYLILRLKLAAYKEAKKDRGQLMLEYAELENRVLRLGNFLKDNQSLMTQLDQLHCELWKCEDQIRSLPETAVLDIAKVGKMIPALNDRRVALIREIDKACGCGEVTEEKIFNVGH